MTSPADFPAPCGEPVDLVLSSGFLAFAAHCGFLDAVEASGIPVGGLCGTSSGALIGSLWAAGLSADRIAGDVLSRAPLSSVRLHGKPWEALFTLRPVLDRIRDLLPPRIEDLRFPFAVGVRRPDGTLALRTQGPLPEAVLASCAVPRLFAPVSLDGEWLSDGGTVDRTAIGPWRALRGDRPMVVHLVERSGRGLEDPLLAALPVVRSPRSGATLLSLGDTAAQRGATRRVTEGVLAGLVSA